MGTGVWIAVAAAYLAGAMPDGVAVLPPPPAPNSPRAQADLAVFRATRALAGTPRWAIAAQDVDNAPIDRFACALGRPVTPAQAPRLARLLDRVSTGATVDPVKLHYATQRPYLRDLAAGSAPAPLCQPRSAHLDGNGDYPSGHAANGWLEGLVLAQVAPRRASAIMARARAYGESRVVCGVHSASAIEAGWMAGTLVFAALQNDAAFRADIRAAQAEWGRLQRGRAPDAGWQAQCQANTSLLANRPW